MKVSIHTPKVMYRLNTGILRRKEVPFLALSVGRVGGISDITVLFSAADSGKDIQSSFSPKAGTAREALWRGLHACGFQLIAAPEPALLSDTVRLVVEQSQV